MHRTAAFLCAEPPEWEYDEAGDPVTPGGRTLTEQIAAYLAAAGCRTSLVEQNHRVGVLVTGSVVTVGEARTLLKPREPRTAARSDR